MYFFHLQTGLNSNYTGAQDLWECMTYLFQLLCKESSTSNSGNTDSQPLEISIFAPPFCGERQAFNLENWTSYIELLTVLLQFLTIPEFRLWAIYVLYW